MLASGLNGKNWKKFLRELEIEKYPSISPAIKEVHLKLKEKKEILFTEEKLTLGRLKKFLSDYEEEERNYTLKNLDFSKFSHRPLLYFQEEGVRFLLSKSRLILADDMGCIEESSIISCNLNKSNHFKCTISELYDKFHNLKKQTKKWEEGEYFVSSLGSDNRFYLSKLLNVVYKGEKQVWEILLEDGKKLKCTPDHKLNNNGNWKQLDELIVGDSIFVNGEGDDIKKTVAKPVKIVQINKTNEVKKVFDLTVENTQNYIANGIVVHNCGKSIQTVIASLCLPEDVKILIVTLRTLKYNFAKEISFYCKDYAIIEKEWISNKKFTIIHYEQIKKFEKEILKENFGCLIADEATAIKNRKSQRTKLFLKIVNKIKTVWLLTGTPMTSRPYDYYNLLKVIKHPIVDNWESFIINYCDGKKNFYGTWDTGGSSNLLDLHNKTKDFVLRRLKTDVLDDLPSKNRSSIFLKLENEKGYNSVIDNYKKKKYSVLEESDKEFLSEEDINVEEITKIMLWRQFCAIQKIKDKSLIDLINFELENDNKVVVFTNFTSVIDSLIEEYPNCSLFIDGRIKSAEERLAIVDNFNATESKRLLILNLKTGAMGLNITSANIGIINDFDWVPGNMIQAEDRLWRIGQKREVNIKYPIYSDTIEEVIYEIINEKMNNISIAIEGKEGEYFSKLDKEKETKTVFELIKEKYKKI